MTSEPTPDITELLQQWRGGDEAAANAAWNAIHSEVRSVVRGLFASESSGHTLQPTAVVNEVYLRIARQRTIGFKDRLQFIGACASTARKVLVSHARKRSADKRGSGATHVTLNAELHGVSALNVDVLDLDRALERIAKYAPRDVEIVELRFFGGLTIAETASALGISPATVKRDWLSIKAKLWGELMPGASDER